MEANFFKTYDRAVEDAMRDKFGRAAMIFDYDAESGEDYETAVIEQLPGKLGMMEVSPEGLYAALRRLVDNRTIDESFGKRTIRAGISDEVYEHFVMYTLVRRS